jgi:hypothetical protein
VAPPEVEPAVVAPPEVPLELAEVEPPAVLDPVPPTVPVEALVDDPAEVEEPAADEPEVFVETGVVELEQAAAASAAVIIKTKRWDFIWFTIGRPVVPKRRTLIWRSPNRTVVPIDRAIDPHHPAWVRSPLNRPRPCVVQ